MARRKCCAAINEPQHYSGFRRHVYCKTGTPPRAAGDRRAEETAGR